MLKRRSTFVLFICFLISTILWLLNDLSKQTTETVQKKIIITSLPIDLSIDSLSKNKIDIKLKGNGFEMIQLFFNNKPIIIEYDEIKNGKFKLEDKYISNFIPENLTIIDTSEKELFCFFSKQQSKKVPISIENIEIDCKSPYKYDQIFINPDSITLSGSEKELNKIDKWQVKKTIYKNIDENINDIIFPEKTNLKYDVKEISLRIEVDKFTQAEINIPITLINYPTDLNIQLHPKSLKIKYLIASKNYNKVTESDFKIICNWEDLNKIKREIKVFEVISPDYLEIINIKQLEKQKISIWNNL